jgi:hypothetical protein
MYEVAHVRDPQHAFFDHIRFRADGREAVLLKSACSEQQGAYVCTGEYQWPAPPDIVSVECTFASITVPNHVHLLHAYKNGKSDQAVFDLSFTNADVRFRPPTAFESAVRAFAGGFMQAVESAAALVFLAALVLAARSRRELIELYGALIAGELCAIIAAPLMHIGLSARFIEAAAALTIAYLALEVALLPQSRMRWMVVAALGAFHGLYFSLFLSEAGYSPGAFIIGIALAQAAVVSGLRLTTRRMFVFTRVVRTAASILLCAGLAWFFVRLWS